MLQNLLSRAGLRLLLVCLAPLVACGGKKGGSEDLCSEVQACGGDVLGGWQIDTLCPDPMRANQLLGAQLPAACADAVVSVDLPSHALALDYSATARSVTGTAALNAVLNLSPACVAAATQFQITLSDAICEVIGSLAVQQLRANIPDAMLACKLGGDSCACDLTGTLTLDSSVSYTTRDNQLVEGDTAQDYCVSGDELVLRSAALGQLHAHRP